MTKRYQFALFSLFSILFVLLYGDLLKLYFTGDDFFHFTVSQTNGSVKSFVRLFGFYPYEERRIAFYRPIFREGLFNIYYQTWGLSVLPFRLTQFLLHCANIFLFFLLLRKVLKNRIVALICALCFGISAVYLVVISYLAGGIQAQGATLFCLISILCFTKYLGTDGKKYYWLSLLSVILGLASHEIAFSIPFILFLYLFSVVKFGSRLFKKSLILLPHFLLLIPYAYIILFVIGFSRSEAQYHFSLSPFTFLNTLAWYVAWAFGLPEMLIDFVGSGLSINPNLWQFWGSYFRFIFPSFFMMLVSLIWILFLTLQSKTWDKKHLLFVGWFVAGILPVLFLPQHKSVYYLAISSVALWGEIALYMQIALEKGKYFLVAIFLMSFLVLNIVSAKLGKETYWAVKRGVIAEVLLQDIKSTYPQLPAYSTLLVKNDPNYGDLGKIWGGTSQQASFILSGSDAVRLLYKDNTLRVVYEDKLTAGERASLNAPYDFVARFPR